MKDKNTDHAFGAAAGAAVGAPIVGIVVGSFTPYFALPAAAGYGAYVLIKNAKINTLEQLYREAQIGEGKTLRKLFSRANRKNKDVFKNISFAQFAKAIDDANVSGEACRYEAVPEKKDLIELAIDSSEIEDKDTTSKSHASTESDTYLKKIEQKADINKKITDKNTVNSIETK